MKFVDCIKSELDIFQEYPQDLSNSEGWWSYYSATGLTVNQGEILIDIPSTEYYIDFSACSLYVKVKIYDSSKTLLDAFDTVNCPISPTNNFLHTVFKQINVDINGTNIENTNLTYPYKAYILNLLNYNHEAKDTILSPSLFYKDNNMDVLAVNKVKIEGVEGNTKEVPVDYNDGFLKRRQVLIDGKGSIEMMGNLHCDLFNSDRLMLNYIPIKIKLWKNDEAFCIMGPADHKYKIYFEEVKLRVRHQKISPSISLAHQNTLLKSHAKYPVRDTQVKICKISNSSLKWTEVLINGIIPDRIIIGMVESLASSGVSTKNPFNFQHFYIEEFKLLVNNSDLPYKNGLTFDFDRNIYLDGYMSIFDTLDKHDLGNNLTREDYKNGFCFFAFNLLPITSCSGDYTSPLKKGTVSVNLKFHAKSTTYYTLKDIDLICLFEYSNQIEIDDKLKASKVQNIII